MTDTAKIDPLEHDSLDAQLRARRESIERGGAPKYHDKARSQNKLFVRERLALLLDDGLEVEDGRWANVLAGDLPADGVITGIGKIGGRRVAVIANDSDRKSVV